MINKLRELNRGINIKTRVMLLLLVVTLPVTSLYVTELRDNYNDLVQKRIENTDNAAKLVSNFFENIFDNVWYLQETIGMQIKNIKSQYDNEEDVVFNSYMLQTVIEPLEYVEGASIFNNFGEYIYGISKNENIAKEVDIYNKNFTKTDIYTKVLNGEDRILSNNSVEKKGGQVYVALAVDGNTYENEIIIVFRMNIEGFREGIFNGYHIDYGTFGLINNYGEIVYDQSINIIGKTNKNLKYEDVYDNTVSFQSNIDETGWKVYAEGFIKKYEIELRKEIGQNMIMFSIVTIIIVAISTALCKYLIGGTDRLKKTIDEIAKNNKKVRTNMKANDEIGQVGRAIDLMLDQLEEVDKEKNAFSMLMAHEVRTPLNVINSAVQCLEEMSTGCCENREFIDKYCRIIKENCYRLNKLVNSIFIATYINANKLEMEMENVEIISCIEDFIMIVSRNIKSKNIEIIFDTESESIVLQCDYRRMNHVILNILSNSIKFSETNTTIFVQFIDGDDYIEIAIKDEGKGISEDVIDKVFNSYSNGEEILNRTAEGVGLGLYISKGIVEAHNGEIKIDSSLNEGTKVTIKLPKIEKENEEPLYIMHDEDEIREKVRIEFSDIY